MVSQPTVLAILPHPLLSSPRGISVCSHRRLFHSAIICQRKGSTILEAWCLAILIWSPVKECTSSQMEQARHKQICDRVSRSGFTLILYMCSWAQEWDWNSRCCKRPQQLAIQSDALQDSDPYAVTTLYITGISQMLQAIWIMSLAGYLQHGPCSCACLCGISGEPKQCNNITCNGAMRLGSVGSIVLCGGHVCPHHGWSSKLWWVLCKEVQWHSGTSNPVPASCSCLLTHTMVEKWQEGSDSAMAKKGLTWPTDIMETDNGERFELTYYVAESSLMHFVWKHAAGMCSTLMCLVQDKVKANGMLNDSISLFLNY